MIDQSKMIVFFDACAEKWDEGNLQDRKVIGKILDEAGVEKGKSVLDIACGTGVLFPYYSEREVSRMVGADIAPNMAAAAREKAEAFPGFSVLCADALKLPFRNEFDVCMVYNALPHFADPSALIASAFLYLREGGCLAVAHGASRSNINSRHHDLMDISRPLPPAEGLAELFRPWFQTVSAISDDEKYIVTGKGKKRTV